jgi:hypothetical protein
VVLAHTIPSTPLRVEVQPGPKKQKLVTETVANPVTYVLPITQQKDHANLKVPQVRPMFSVNVIHPISQRNDTVEFKNNANGCVITYTKGTEVIWNGSYKSEALLAGLTDFFIAVAYTDTTLHLHSLAGTRLFPPLKMPSVVSFIHCVDQYLVFVDCLGKLTLWNIQEQCTILDSVTCLGLLTEKVSIVSCLLHTDMMPILQTSTRESFLYSKNMKTWMKLDQLQASPVGFQKSLPKLEEIESKWVTAIHMRDANHVTNSIRLYARKLADETALTKTKELVHMLRYFYCSSSGVGEMGGAEKAHLREIVVPILARNRSFQRILTDMQ